MPADENGDKWACEPCIRGHRSTRCEHWDRFMLRVKKPGRPLSTCPHPKNQCTCGRERVMMVRIPKASSCICAPAYSLGPDGLPSQPETPPGVYPFTNPPQALASPITNPYRIQKAGQRRGSIISPQAVARGLEADQRYQGSLLPQVSPDQDFAPPMQTNGRLNGHSENNHVQKGNGTIASSSNGPHGSVQAYTGGQDMKREESGTLVGSSQSGSAVAHSQLYQLSHPESSGSSPASQVWLRAPLDDPKVASNSSPHVSCCHGKNSKSAFRSLEEPNNGKNGAESAVTYTSERSPHTPYENIQPPSYSASFGPKEAFSYSTVQGDWPVYPGQTTLYTLPSTYATASHPLNPTQMARFQQSLESFTQTVPYYVPYGVTGSAAPSADGSTMFNPVHNCGCGDGCNCLGCAAHPYNATTLHHVQDLGQILEDGYVNQPQSRPQSSYGSPINMIDVHCMLSEGASANNNHFSSPNTRGSQDLVATPTNDSIDGPVTSAALESVLPSYPVFSSSSYYTVEFPMDQRGVYSVCTDITGSCQCGSDCACIGCLTHTGHDGDPFLDPTVMQQVLEQPSHLTSPQSLGSDMPPEPAPTPSRPSCCG